MQTCTPIPWRLTAMADRSEITVFELDAEEVALLTLVFDLAQATDTPADLSARIATLRDELGLDA